MACYGSSSLALSSDDEDAKHNTPTRNTANNTSTGNKDTTRPSSRRQSITLTSLLPFQGKHQNNASADVFVSPKKKRRASMNDAQCLGLGFKFGKQASVPVPDSVAMAAAGNTNVDDLAKGPQSPAKSVSVAVGGDANVNVGVGGCGIRSVFGGSAVGGSASACANETKSKGKEKEKEKHKGKCKCKDKKCIAVQAAAAAAAAQAEARFHTAKPVLSFQAGDAWKQFPLDSDTLYLDLFWPVEPQRSIVNDIMAVEAMAPLCNFRQLRFLKLTGMSQSYQKYIWQAAWLNPGLEELELEMALEPCIRRTFNAGWPSIKGDWVRRSEDNAVSSYYGDGGLGILHRRVGIGEYLDKFSIAAAQERAAKMTTTPLARLPIVKLTLTGFVVDADPFRLYFNPHRLRLINFRNDCVDAGFALPANLAEQVVVNWPRTVRDQAMIARVVRPGELKIVDIKRAKKHGDGGAGAGAGPGAIEGPKKENIQPTAMGSPSRQGGLGPGEGKAGDGAEDEAEKPKMSRTERRNRMMAAQKALRKAKR
ncbi:hypothetical protein FQN53_004987 [Emmonsiellopsis sp. PD_33]|nr:hypothetical protein FQN53_004987 [Emmonsiellopsis sp. PD_33]